MTVPFGSRNGNLQITQFYYGAAQPSRLAAQIAGALFYGQAQDDGFPRSSSERPRHRQHRLGPARRRRHRRGHRPDRLGHALPVQLAVLRRRQHRLLPGQRRRPDQRPDPCQGTGQVPDPRGRSRAGRTSPSTRSTTRRSSSARCRRADLPHPGPGPELVHHRRPERAAAASYFRPWPSGPRPTRPRATPATTSLAGNTAGQIFVTYNGGGTWTPDQQWRPGRRRRGRPGRSSPIRPRATSRPTP